MVNLESPGLSVEAALKALAFGPYAGTLTVAFAFGDGFFPVLRLEFGAQVLDIRFSLPSQGYQVFGSESASFALNVRAIQGMMRYV